ncbi:MAG: hypothetical protein WCR52_13855, partial [Bacteroidota bacterium]
MTAKEFVLNFYKERQRILESSFDIGPNARSYVSTKIEDLNLDEQQTEKLKHIISALLTDTFYGILLGLDGSATIGDNQETFKITGEDGKIISECGDIEGEAYEIFSENRIEFENANCDFIAQLYFKKTEDGGRSSFVSSGYRSQIKFSFTEMQTSGQQTYIDNKMAFPGDNINALIKLSTTQHLKGQLKIGSKFEFLEGSKIVGTGRILKIKN